MFRNHSILLNNITDGPQMVFLQIFSKTKIPLIEFPAFIFCISIQNQ